MRSRQPGSAGPRMELIRNRVGRHAPSLQSAPQNPRSQAAVALIFHESSGGDTGPELLFIERATREGDPWSGQMAFPGGRREPGDPGLDITAARETLEEVGIELPQPIGRLDDFSNSRQAQRLAHVERVHVSPYVYELPSRPQVSHNYEVASTVWVPLRWILAQKSVSTYQLEHDVYRGTFPAFTYAGYTVWGMTYRILECLADVIDVQLPARRVFPGRFDDEDG